MKGDGGPAFPQTHESWGGNGEASPVPEGMTLRDWFAGQALAGFSLYTAQKGYPIQPGDPDNRWAAEAAYALADAMLSEREISGGRDA